MWTAQSGRSDTQIAATRVLLVGADLQWSRAVRAVANDLGGIPVDAVRSGRSALSRLLSPATEYSHVLVNPARDDGLLLSLQGLTCDEEASGAEMMLLGRSPGAPSHICVIPGPAHAAIWSGLAFGCRDGLVRPPSVAALRAALAEQRIETRYQPVVRLRDGAVTGIEALARLHRIGERLVGPDRFVPRIEDAGLAVEFTHLVAKRSFADVTSATLAPHRLSVALNVPLDVMLLPAALDRLRADREEAGIDAARVVIELTESRVVRDLSQLQHVVERLRHAGHAVALDDISPAMAHHEALLDIPFTAVKLDRGVVSRGAAADFVKRTIAAARARGMLVIVEGVEDVPTWHRMHKAGADLAQGFIIGRPVPAAVLPAWMGSWRKRHGAAAGPLTPPPHASGINAGR